MGRDKGGGGTGQQGGGQPCGDPALVQGENSLSSEGGDQEDCLRWQEQKEQIYSFNTLPPLWV